MTELDDTDAEILRLLMEDARRSFTDIGDQVGLSSPSVSNRVTRLMERGIITRFTVDIDRSQLVTGDEVLIEIEAQPGKTDEIVELLADVDSVECILQAFEPRVSVHAYMDGTELARLFGDVVDEDLLRDYEIRKIADSVWRPRIGQADLAVECVQCGKSIEGEGITVELQDRRYSLCCPSCESLFREEYEALKNGADGSD